MGLMSRFSMILKSKASTMLDKAEDPRETLDYSYEKQLEMLQKVRRSVADVATSKKRIELQAKKLEGSIEKLDSQARAALQGNREDLARIALERKAGVQSQLRDLDVQREQLEVDQQKLVATEQKLTAKVESFRTQKETIKAQYTAAEAQTKITESLTGIGEDMADVGMAVDRAQNKIETMQARSGALDELIESGALDEIGTGGKDDLDRQLEELTAGASVESELEALRAELGSGDAPAAELGSGEDQA